MAVVTLTDMFKIFSSFASYCTCCVVLCLCDFECVQPCKKVHTLVCVFARGKWLFYIRCIKIAKYKRKTCPCMREYIPVCVQ